MFGQKYPRLQVQGKRKVLPSAKVEGAQGPELIDQAETSPWFKDRCLVRLGNAWSRYREGEEERT